jgi:lipopolysaccharide export system ATP-binding protein
MTRETPAAGAPPEAATLRGHLLEVVGLEKIYGRRPVVRGVSFHVEAGEIVGLLGRNGAGKTTTFRMTVGLVEPDGGKVYFDGRDIAGLPMYRRARLGIGYLSQEASVFKYLTAEENILAILERYERGPAKDARLEELIQQFGLSKVRKSLAVSLSGGERRRLEIARALVTKPKLMPKLMLLDEPFAAIDPITVGEIQEIVRGLRAAGIGVLLTDHNVRETLKTTDRAYIILDGKILVAGTPAEVIDDPTARAVYLGENFTL